MIPTKIWPRDRVRVSSVQHFILE